MVSSVGNLRKIKIQDKLVSVVGNLVAKSELAHFANLQSLEHGTDLR